MAILWQDTFEGGEAITVNYGQIVDAETAVAVGISGSRGARTTGSSSEQYYGEFSRAVTTSERGGTAIAYFDHAYVGNGTDGYSAIEVRGGNIVAGPYGHPFLLGVTHDETTNGVHLFYASATEGVAHGPIIQNAYTPGTFTKIELRWCLSTVDSTTDPEIWASNPDGTIQVFINDLLVSELTGVALDAVFEDTPIIRWKQIAFGPMGNLDNIVITDEGCATPTSVPPPPCCAYPGPGGAPPGQGPGDPPVDTPRVIPPGGDPPSYTPCATGGDPADATDPTVPQSLTDAITPLVHLQITLPDTTVVRYGDRAFTSGNGGAVTARVTHWGDVIASLADRSGNIEAQRLAVRLSDTDRVLRGYLGSPANRNVDGREAIVFIETRVNAAALVAPNVLARGIVTSWRGLTDMEIEIEISDPLGYRYSQVSLDRLFPQRRIRAELFPYAPEHTIGKPVPVIYGDYSDDFTWSINPARIPVGIVPVIDVGRAVDIPGLEGLPEDHWRAWVVCGHAVGGIMSWFASNNYADGPGSVRMEAGTEGVDFLIPGYAGYAARFADPYIDITGTDGITERFTMVFSRGPRSESAISGQVPITLNVCGIEDVGDGSGDVITNTISQIQHFICEFVLQNYKTGNWGPVPTFPGGTPKIRTTSFDACRTITAARVGAGYFGAWYIGEQKAMREWLADLQLGSDLRLGIDAGQILAATLDETATASISYDTTHIEESLFDVDPRLEDVFNIQEFQCALEAATGRYAWPVTTLRNETSITAHGARQADTLHVITTQLLANASDVAMRRLQLGAEPVALVRFPVDLRGLAPSLGDLIEVTHFAGISATGWTNRTLRKIRRVTDPNEFLCTLEAEDVHDIVGGVFMLLDTGTLDGAVLG